MATYTCRECGSTSNPEGASRCIQCNAPLELVTAANAAVRGSGATGFWDRVLKFLQGGIGERRDKRSTRAYPRSPQPGTSRLDAPSGSGAHEGGAMGVSPATPARVTATSSHAVQPIAQSTPAQPSLKPYGIGELFYGRYHIGAARELKYSVYYDAMDLFCAHPECQKTHPHFPPAGMCEHCRQPLDTVLIHERRVANGGIAPEMIRALLLLGRANHPRILHHRSILRLELAVYTVVNHPGQWLPLVQSQRPYTADDAVAVVSQMGRALTYLHQQGFAYTGSAQSTSKEGMEGWVILNGGDVKLADLSQCAPLAREDAGRAQIARDIAFLGHCLIYLTHDPQYPMTSDLAHVPRELKACVERAKAGQYSSVVEMFNDLTVMLESPTAGRLLKPTEGHATHQGRRHTRNEDMIVTFTFDKKQQGKSVPIGFYMVADGMGGHDAGDVASRTVYEVVTKWIVETNILPDLRKTTRKLTTENVPGDLLQQAIQAANEALVRHAQVHNSNLGSTVTAALVIGDVATIANVGDSRTYLLRKGQLRQITQDHSLVARLVEAKVITPEEVREHPQRNQIYRNLGQKSAVQVDIFTVHLQPDDRLILCCDGLWEMVSDADIQRIVEASRTPQKACDTLIAAANQAGGEDNISVIVVEME